MESNTSSEKAIEFIKVDERRRFSITPEAVTFLKSLKGKKNNKKILGDFIGLIA